MNTRSSNESHARSVFLFLVCVFACLLALASSASGDQTIYFRTTPPNPAQVPSADGWHPTTNPGGWRNVTGATTTPPNSAPLVIPSGGVIYFAIINMANPPANSSKSVTLRLSWALGDYDKFKVLGATGVNNGATSVGYVSSGKSGGFSTRTIHIGFRPCPQWEFVCLQNFGAASQTIQVAPKADPTNCKKLSVSSSPQAGPDDDTMHAEDALFGVPGQMTAPFRFTELLVFPEHLDLNQGVPPEFIAPPHTGNWSAQPVFVDPHGRAHPGGGVRFVSDGFGLALADPHSFSITTLDRTDNLYSLFAFDHDVGDWVSYRIDANPLPWYEDFDPYDPDDALHGFGGWKGWDDDPAFDAPTTDAPSRSPDRSLEIAGDADLVRPFEGADSGAWTFEAWQYIPSDFASGGGGDFAGSYFNLLNTYHAGGPYHWSVQMQFDSTDGLVKVFHADGIDRVSVPIETDRWVKIQTIIDLEDDWTRVYYDDELVTEYSWTSGVLGDGGGALDIAAVDLYAQGSSPVFYDDLLLEPIAPCGGDLTTTGASEGDPTHGVRDFTTDLSDLLYFVNVWDADLGSPTPNPGSIADTTTTGGANPGVPDGNVDLSDLLHYVNDWSVGLTECP